MNEIYFYVSSLLWRGIEFGHSGLIVKEDDGSFVRYEVHLGKKWERIAEERIPWELLATYVNAKIRVKRFEEDTAIATVAKNGRVYRVATQHPRKIVAAVQASRKVHYNGLMNNCLDFVIDALNAAPDVYAMDTQAPRFFPLVFRGNLVRVH